jgi:hypothetical protein
LTPGTKWNIHLWLGAWGATFHVKQTRDRSPPTHYISRGTRAPRPRENLRYGTRTAQRPGTPSMTGQRATEPGLPTTPHNRVRRGLRQPARSWHRRRATRTAPTDETTEPPHSGGGPAACPREEHVPPDHLQLGMEASESCHHSRDASPARGEREGHAARPHGTPRRNGRARDYDATTARQTQRPTSHGGRGTRLMRTVLATYH